MLPVLFDRARFTFLAASLCGSLCAAQPQFSFQALPELPGGAAEPNAIEFLTPTLFKPNPVAVAGRSLDGDGLWKAVVWSKVAGQPWEIEVLPNPFGNTGAVCRFIEEMIVRQITLSAGSADDLGGVSQPVMWFREDEGPWVAEVPPLPPGYDSGAALSVEGVSGVINHAVFAGWVDQAEGPEPPHAARWEKDLDSRVWTVELLPDYGPGFSSEAHVVEIMKDGTDGKSFIGGHVQPDSGFGQLPCVWDEQDGGGHARTDLPMTPGAYLGNVSRLMEEEGIYEFSAVGYNASIAGLADLYRGVLYRRSGGLWSEPLALPPVAGLRDSRASGIAAVNSTSPGGLTAVGHSYVELNPGSERATLWEIAPDQSIFAYDLNDLTVDLPPDVVLGARPVVGNIDADPEPEAFAVGFTYVESPLTPRAGLLILLSGEDCNMNGMDDTIDLLEGTSGDANDNGIPDECELLFKFAALPELPGGQSTVLAGREDGIGPGLIRAFGGRALDGDQVWKPGVWLFYPGCLPFEGWMLEVLPNPLGNFGGATLTIEIDRALYPDAWVLAAGYVDGGIAHPNDWKTPALWARNGVDDWTAELPTPPPPYDSGAFLAVRRPLEPFGDPIGNYSLSGWVGQSAGPEPHHAVACDMTRDGGGWTAFWSLLPDYGPGFFSEATSIAIDPVDKGNPEDGLRIIGGSLQTDTSSQAPCVWQELPGGGFERVDLPMAPGGEGGAVASCCDVREDCTWYAGDSWCVGRNTFPGNPSDFDQAVLYPRTGVGWVDSLLLPPLVDCPHSLANSAVPGTSNSPDGVTVVGQSFGCGGANDVIATAWEVDPGNSITVYNLNEQTVNLPVGVNLQSIYAPDDPLYDPIALSAQTTATTDLSYSIGGSYTDGAGAARGPSGGPHGYVLNSIVRGNCCGRDDQDQPFCLDIADITDCGPLYGGHAVSDCNECDRPPTLHEPNGVDKNRFASFVVPVGFPPQAAALRVRLASLHHPADPPPGTPDFSAFENTYRYVNSVPPVSLCVGGSNPVAACTDDTQCLGGGTCQTLLHTCPDSVTYGTKFRCATLGCQPEYRDWAGELGGDVLHVTGDAVAPSSIYEVSQVSASCGPAPWSNACLAGSPTMIVGTAQWGDVAAAGNGPPDGATDVLDIAAMVNKVKDLPTAFFEPLGWLKFKKPDPVADAVNVLEISLCVDAVLLKPYPPSYTIDACP